MQENDHLLAIAKKIMENVDWRHLTTGSSGLTGQARSQLNRMFGGPFGPRRKNENTYKNLDEEPSSKESLDESSKADSTET